MNKLLQSLRPRQLVLLLITASVIVYALAAHHLMFPAYDKWQAMKADLDLRKLEYARLKRNVSIKESVAEQFRKLGPSVFQAGSDEMTFSRFLREFEAIDRIPSMTLDNAKPLPVEDKGTHKVYRVRLSVAGRLQEVIKFVTDLAGRNEAIGLEAFSLRGAHGSSMVRCRLSLRMVQLVPERQARGRPSA